MRRFIPSWRLRLPLSVVQLWQDDVDDDDPRMNDPLLLEIMSFLETDIPDTRTRRNIALILRAHIRSRFTHYPRDMFEPYIGVDGQPPDTMEDALQVMRDAVIKVAGYDREGGSGK